jgi:hypothetical protein
MVQNSNGYDKDCMAPGDSFFAAIGKAAEEEMLKECELWEKEAGDIRVPEKAEARILALARKLEKRQLNKKRDHLIRRYAKTAAVIVVLVSVSFTALLANADALRGRFFDFVFQDNDTYTKVIPVQTSDNGTGAEKNLPADWKEVYYPDYLPQGYLFTESTASGTAKTIIFQNRQEDTLVLTQEPSDGAEILVDKDGVKSGETSVQGNPAFWTDKDSELTLMWNEYGVLFMLYGPLDMEEMTKVAEHLLYVE